MESVSMHIKDGVLVQAWWIIFNTTKDDIRVQLLDQLESRIPQSRYWAPLLDQVWWSSK